MRDNMLVDYICDECEITLEDQIMEDFKICEKCGRYMRKVLGGTKYRWRFRDE